MEILSPDDGATAEQGDGHAFVRLDVSGMHCGSCAALIEETLADRSGIQRVSVSLDAAKAEIEFNSSAIDLDEIVTTITGLGYPASIAAEGGAST